ncbi:SAM-dependent methyltransferase [Halieaceae bacterium IMCC14734]|uniref:S-adenosyl-L-methionine-dependent methyltransferase n=1 Tax=Candidatus Litorirhabdus singularis TaxID=2518993 RepID=A0ABT3TBI6_9GAMM|nr:class I SAM-dependent methyltransferase [Candidatus Litorirhabdus singularis]MCX2979630.1 SAM-dependent methyltransferase [Candidatus Litorirhabdus singularis]
MRTGQVSQTALKVAATMVTLAQQPRWHRKLPADLPELSERLILAAGEPLYSPTLMRITKRRWAVNFSKLAEFAQPGIFYGLGARKIFMNEKVLAALAAGATQVLVIGAGFDTLCLRLAQHHPEINFFEIDHPDTARAKRRGVEREGCPCNLQLISADLATVSLDQVLSETQQWNSQATTAAVAEGLLYYLPATAVRELFKHLHGTTGADSQVAFSHIVRFNHLRLARVALDIAGEPWLSAASVTELPRYLGPGWKVIATDAGRGRDLEGFAVVQKA